MWVGLKKFFFSIFFLSNDTFETVHRACVLRWRDEIPQSMRGSTRGGLSWLYQKRAVVEVEYMCARDEAAPLSLSLRSDFVWRIICVRPCFARALVDSLEFFYRRDIDGDSFECT